MEVATASTTDRLAGSLHLALRPNSLTPVANLSRGPRLINMHTDTHTRLTAFVRHYPGEPVPER